MNIAALERERDQKKDAATDLFKKTMVACEAHTNDKGEKEPRVMTAEERAAVQSLIDESKALQSRIDAAKGDESMSAEIAKLTAGMTTPKDATGEAVETRSLGQQFVESPAMAWLRQSHGVRGTAWTSPSVELNDQTIHGTTLDTSTASGGYLITTDYRPGILPLLFKRLVVADLLASGRTDSNSVTYMRETTFTNAAAPVSEGGTKPESTLVFDQVTDLVRKIAHWLPATEEMLEDVAQIRSYIDARLRLGVQLTEEDQLLNGSGTAPAITGIMNRSGLSTAQARSSDTNIDAIFKQITNIFTTAFIQPDGVVINPANWQTIQLSKDNNLQYYGSGPFAPPQRQTLWGLPVVVTPSIVANTALVGAFAMCAQVFRKGGIRVEASNSHSDFFVKNLVAIRAEERLALAVYRPAGFGKVTGLN